MCARFIVDKNVIFIILDPEDYGSERDPVFRDWYDDGHGVLFYADTGIYADENQHHLGILEEYAAAGRANLVSESRMREAEHRLDRSDVEIKSDDRHMLALSLASEATILCTRDKRLNREFQDLEGIDGKSRKVYFSPPEIEKREEFLAQNRCEKVTPADPAGA